MTNIGLHRFALTVCLCVLVLVGAGAAVTTENAGLAIPDWPLAFGSILPARHPGTPSPAFHLAMFHRSMAAVAVLLIAVLTVWTWIADGRPLVRGIATAALALAVAQALLGGVEVLLHQPRFAGVLHACLAQLCFGLVCCAALLTSPAWKRSPQHVNDYGWPSLRTLAIWTPLLVFLQILLGALFRHHVWSVVPHIIGAMFVSGVVLLFGLFVVSQFPKHETLRKTAMATLTVTFMQIMLGVFTYLSGSAAAETAVPGLLPASVIVAHVVTGGILLVFSLMLGMQVRRHVLPKLAPAETMQAAS